MPEKLYIIGASGFGREVADTVHAINDVAATYEIAGFSSVDLIIEQIYFYQL